MQISLLDTYAPTDFSGKSVLIPLSGGINSASILPYLVKYCAPEMRPGVLHLHHTYLPEHSPDTTRFTIDCWKYAKKHFRRVYFAHNAASMNKWCLDNKMIPHPAISPCSRLLKIEPRQKYAAQMRVDFVMVGYVRGETKRHNNAQKRNTDGKTLFPIYKQMDDDDCFELVKQEIGWYPAIYDIKDEAGKRVFKHNNCLPCKNMTEKEFADVGKFFPKYAQRAIDVAAQIPEAFWGRNDVPEVFKCDVCTRLG